MILIECSPPFAWLPRVERAGEYRGLLWGWWRVGWVPQGLNEYAEGLARAALRDAGHSDPDLRRGDRAFSRAALEEAEQVIHERERGSSYRALREAARIYEIIRRDCDRDHVKVRVRMRDVEPAEWTNLPPLARR